MHVLKVSSRVRAREKLRSEHAEEKQSFFHQEKLAGTVGRVCLFKLKVAALKTVSWVSCLQPKLVAV